LWDLDQAIELADLQIDDEHFSSVGFSPDGRYLLVNAQAGDTDGKIVELWAVDPAASISRIQFEPGATTWATEGPTIRGETKRYAVYALAGQTMQVFLSGSGTGLSIWGEDGTVLKGKQDDDPFWRGKLPLTQDYFIELNTFDRDWVEDSVSMFIAISAPGQESQSIPYSDPGGYFKLEYSDYFAIDPEPGLITQTQGEELLRLAFVGTEFFEGTNLIQAFVAIARTDDPQIVAECMGPLDPYSQDLGTEVINGRDYFKSSYSDGGMGRFYSQSVYQTANAGACFEVIFFEDVYSVEHFAPEFVLEEFDEAGVIEKMREVLRNLEFTG